MQDFYCQVKFSRSRIPQVLAFRWFAFQACSLHAVEDLIEPINVVFQGGCCNDHVIHVTHHQVPVLFRHSGQILSHRSLKSGRCVAQAEGHPLPLVQPQFTCKSGLLPVLLPQRYLPEGRTQVSVSLSCNTSVAILTLLQAVSNISALLLFANNKVEDQR